MTEQEIEELQQRVGAAVTDALAPLMGAEKGRILALRVYVLAAARPPNVVAVIQEHLDEAMKPHLEMVHREFARMEGERDNEAFRERHVEVGKRN